MKNCITIRQLNERGDSALSVTCDQAQTILSSEQRSGNFIYIPESQLGVYSPLDVLPTIQEKIMEILVFPPVKGG